MKASVLILTVILVGCGSKVGEKKQSTVDIVNCPVEKQSDIADFTLQCIANANPKSDEEPEDWIGMCRTMAVETYCEITQQVVTKTCVHGSSTACYEWAIQQ